MSKVINLEEVKHARAQEQLKFVMMEDRCLSEELLAHLKAQGYTAARCIACDSLTDFQWAREDRVEVSDTEEIRAAFCLPCYLHNNTNVPQELIDHMVRWGTELGMYIEE